MSIRKKIIKNFFIQKFLALIVVIYIFIVKVTSTTNYENIDIPKYYWKNNKSFILAFWHNQLLTISFAWKNEKKINILASGHSDGRFGAIVGKYFRLNNISTSKLSKGISLRPVFEILNSKNYLGITPDGPRGPKEKVSEGIIKIAKISKTPIIPIGFWSSKNFTLNSWDSFLITLPFSKCNFVWGEEITIPNNINDDELINYQNILEKKINECIKKAKNNCK